MPTRRLPDSKRWKPPAQCRHPDHNPPSHEVFEPGTYEHTCPACGRKTIFVVPERPTLSDHVSQWRFVP